MNGGFVKGLLAVLALSLGANAALAWKWHGRRSAPPAGVASAEPMQPMTEAWRRPFPGVGGGVNPVALDSCVVRGSWLADQLAALEEVRAKLVPAARRFEQAQVDEEQTAAFTKAFTAQLPSGQKRELEARKDLVMECRDRWCRLTLPAGDKQPWLAEAVAQFRQSEWLAETMHEVDAPKGTLLFERHTPGAVPSDAVLQQALHDFESSGAVEACQSQHRGDGTLDAEVTLAASDDSGRPDTGFTVQAKGALAGTPLGKCIDERFRQALAAIQLPPRYAASSALVQFPRP